MLTPSPQISQTGVATELGASELILPAFGSTPAQDEQRCKILKLPDDMQLVSEYQSWRRMTGAWLSHNNVRLGAWTQSHVSSSYDTVYVNSDVDQGLALQASVKSAEEMRYLYGWRAQPEPQPGVNIPLVDCDQRLMFVIHQRATELREMDIYAPDGSLLASSLVDWNIERIQFVASDGFLIATAESPAVFANISRDALGGDPTKGNVLPYGIHFEVGGYADASRLLDTEYHWVIASAIQMRAILLAEQMDVVDGIPRPTAVSIIAVLVWLSLALGGFACCGLLLCIHRAVYPREIGENPFFRVPPKPTTKAWYTKAV